jgi:predicted ATPase
VLETQFPETVENQPEELAQHFTEAGMPEEAITYWLKAGQQAMTRWTMVEAVALLRRGLKLVSALPENELRQQHELDLQIACGRALMVAKGLAVREADAAFARARQLCEQLKRPAQLGPVLWAEFQIRFNRAELEQLRHEAEEIRQLGETSNDLLLEWLGCHSCGCACHALGEFSVARAYLERCLVLVESEHCSAYFTLMAELPSLGGVLLFLARTLCCIGYFDQARIRIDEVRPDSPGARCLTFTTAWLFGWCVGAAPESLLQRADVLLAAAMESGFAQFRAVGSIFRGWCLAAMRRPDEGVALITTGLDGYRATGTLHNLPTMLTLLAVAYGMAGQPHAARERLTEALQICGVTGQRWAEAEMHRLRGELLIATSDPVTAEVSFRQALTLARQQNARLWELRAATSLARLWRGQGKRTEAHELLAPVYDWFTEGFDTADLKEAKALLDELT